MFICYRVYVILGERGPLTWVFKPCFKKKKNMSFFFCRTKVRPWYFFSFSLFLCLGFWNFTFFYTNSRASSEMIINHSYSSSVRYFNIGFKSDFVFTNADFKISSEAFLRSFLYYIYHGLVFFLFIVLLRVFSGYIHLYHLDF